ncbi:MAG: hypothetical protein ACREMQ_00955 [Longimicrobiales bacterium]
MNATFYLFDVDHGQCAALQLPDGRWCMFDAGRTASFSPISWLAAKNGATEYASLFAPAPSPSPPCIYKATVSHLHGDHIADWPSLRRFGPDLLRTVAYDRQYLADVAASSASGSLDALQALTQDHVNSFGPARQIPDYGGSLIYERELGVDIARSIGGPPNSRVNNASVVTRIHCHGTSILLCGDVETEAWKYAFTQSFHFDDWRRLVSGVDVLVAPHHGHSAGFSPELLRLANPRVVLVSIRSRDEHADERYSDSAFVRGELINGETRRCITTRQSGHIRLSLTQGVSLLEPLAGNTRRYWTFGDVAIERYVGLGQLLRGYR